MAAVEVEVDLEVVDVVEVVVVAAVDAEVSFFFQNNLAIHIYRNVYIYRFVFSDHPR